MNAFHSGCIGDIIYAIPAMQSLGVTKLYVDNRDWTKPIVNRIGVFSRLLENNGVSVSRHNGEDIDVDFSTFRNGGMRYGENISHRIARWVGADIDLSKPWIKSDKNNLASGKVVVSRGARWHGEFFQWKQIVDVFRSDIIFIGLPEEHEDFCRRFGKIEYFPTIDLYDAAEVISGADLFIGNQSSPNALANALHASSVVELCLYACDCIYERGNAIYCANGDLQFEFNGRKFEYTRIPERNGWEIVWNGRSYKATEKHLCIALARAETALRKESVSVDELTSLLKRY